MGGVDKDELAALLHEAQRKSDERFSTIMNFLTRRLEETNPTGVRDMLMMAHLIGVLGALLMRMDSSTPEHLLGELSYLKERFPNPANVEGAGLIKIIESMWREEAESRVEQD